MISKVITPGSPEDRMPFGKLCELLAQKIITANPNHQRHRTDLYREVRIHGRAYYVRVKVTVPFLTIVPPHLTRTSMPPPPDRIPALNPAQPDIYRHILDVAESIRQARRAEITAQYVILRARMNARLAEVARQEREEAELEKRVRPHKY